MRLDELWNQSIKLDLKTQAAEMLKCTSNLKVKRGNVQKGKERNEKRGKEWKF